MCLLPGAVWNVVIMQQLYAFAYFICVWIRVLGTSHTWKTFCDAEIKRGVTEPPYLMCVFGTREFLTQKQLRKHFTQLNKWSQRFLKIKSDAIETSQLNPVLATKKKNSIPFRRCILTCRPTKLLWRLTFALTSCSFSLESINLLAYFKPYSMLSLHPPHSNARLSYVPSAGWVLLQAQFLSTPRAQAFVILWTTPEEVMA